MIVERIDTTRTKETNNNNLNLNRGVAPPNVANYAYRRRLQNLQSRLGLASRKRMRKMWKSVKYTKNVAVAKERLVLLDKILLWLAFWRGTLPKR